jgi:hypothetical protein
LIPCIIVGNVSLDRLSSLSQPQLTQMCSTCNAVAFCDMALTMQPQINAYKSDTKDSKNQEEATPPLNEPLGIYLSRRQLERKPHRQAHESIRTEAAENSANFGEYTDYLKKKRGA